MSGMDSRASTPLPETELDELIFTNQKMKAFFTEAVRALTFVFTALALLVVITGCQSQKVAEAFDATIFGTRADLAERMKEYKHVLLVRVHQDRLEDKGPNRYALHHFDSTVVKTYKGDWKISEKASFVHGMDSRVNNATNTNNNELLFVFTNEHGVEEFAVGTGDFLRYDARIDHQLEILFPDPNR